MIKNFGLAIYHQAGNHRTPWFPGQSLADAPEEVVAAAANLWTPEAVAQWRQERQGEPTPPPTNWDGLNQAIMANIEFNQAYATTMQTYPLVAAALPAALTQVASGQTAMFETTFLAMCQIAQVSPEQRGIWADIGATFNAPPEFLDIVRGVNNGE